MESLSKKGFHYLGVPYEVAQTSHSTPAEEKERAKIQVKVGIHKRTCQRALDRVKVLRSNAVNPAKIQHYLVRWAAWWHHSGDLSPRTNISKWIETALRRFDEDGWLGAGILFPWSTPAFDPL